ncbi:MAG TPA: DUF1579 family protein [Kofleriaceae bacterium]|nr:DUF1579 family protein [Kofleriaceae bacterium]
MRSAALALVMAGACGGASPAARRPAPSATIAAPEAPSAACATPEHRAFDFWIGAWDVKVLTRKDPAAPWITSAGTQRIESILGGCVISENFAAEGPDAPWSGKSYSMWQPALGTWRQTWVDDQGSYLVFTGGVENGAMTLYGEPFERAGKHVEMRMVFRDVARDALTWEWQRKGDDGAWVAQMVIEYRRATR